MPASQGTSPAERKLYWKSLLQIEVPICVTLAVKEIPSEQVVRLVPGMMIHFDKPYDQPLNLEVDGQAIATGDVVKVGDKFGLKIVAVQQRDERWVSLSENESQIKSRTDSAIREAETSQLN